MADPMEICDVGEIYHFIDEFIDPVAERAMFEECTVLFDRSMEHDYTPSVTDASMASESASDSPSEHTRPTTLDRSEVTSNAPSPDPDQHDMMQGTGANANNRDHPTRARAQQSVRNSALDFPVLIEEHKEPIVLDRPATLPPSGGLVDDGPLASTAQVHLRGSRLPALAPRPGTQAETIMSWKGSPPQTEVSEARSPRSRKVADPLKTAAVRKATSCQHCAVHKRDCDEHDLCARCGKWDPANHGRVCIRSRPNVILDSGRGSILNGGRWTPSSQPSVSLGHGARLGQPIRITVYFTPFDSQGLQIHVAMQADGNWRIVSDRSAYESELLKWAENNLRRPSSRDFQRSVEAFLYLYAQRKCVEKRSLVDSVVRMSSLWRLISANELWYTKAGEVERRPLHAIDHAIVALQLKHFACCMMASAEDQAINGFGGLIPNAFNEGNTDAPAVWASLWSLIIVYRQALQIAARTPESFKDGFGQVTGKLLDALIVALADHFRTSRLQNALNETYQSSFQGNPDVMAAYIQARLERRIAYEQFQATKSYGDDLIHAHIEKKEQSVMRRKGQKGKQSKDIELAMPDE